MKFRYSNISALSASVAMLGLVSACSMKKNMDDMKDTTQLMAGDTKKMAETTEGMASTTNDMKDTTKGMAIDTHEMKDTTKGMSAVTEKMAKTTDNMSVVTDHMSKTTDALYKDNRQGQSLTIRSERLAAMEKAEVIDAKIVEAGKYFMAFEFQLWKNFGEDTEAKKMSLYEEGVTELFRDVARYVESDRDPSPSSTDDKMQNLYALAVTLHRINPNELELAEKNNLPKISMLSLIEAALNMKSDIDCGKVDKKDVPAFVHIVLTQEANAQYLLRLRANFLGAMALAKISKIIEGGATAWWAKINMYTRTWHTQVGKLNLEQIREYSVWLKEAIRTRDYLKGLGLDPLMNSKMLKIYRKMIMYAEPSPKPGNEAKAEQYRQAIDELNAAIQEFRYPGVPLTGQPGR